MMLKSIIGLEQYADAWEFANANGYLVQEIEKSQEGKRQFQIVEKPKPTEEEILIHYRNRRELDCFSIINRGQLWYNTLNEEQLKQLDVWYKEWLDVTETKIIPSRPQWLK